jgi:hypothetical protein
MHIPVIRRTLKGSYGSCMRQILSHTLSNKRVEEPAMEPDGFLTFDRLHFIRRPLSSSEVKKT